MIYQTAYWPKRGGVNNAVPDFLIDDSEFADLRNYEPDLTGGNFLVKRAGLTKSSDNKTAGTGSVYQGRNANYFHNGSVIYNFAGTSISTGKAAAYDDWTTFATYDIMVNGTDVVYSNNGTSFSTISGWPSNVKYVASINNFCYFVVSLGTLYWCEMGTLTYNAALAFTLTQDESDDIVGIKAWDNALLVLCSKSHGMITGWEDLEQDITYWSSSEGCIGFRTIVISPFGAFWFSRAGMVWCTKDMRLDYPMLRKIPVTLAGLNRAQDALIHGVWNKARQCVSYWVPSGAAQTTNNLQIDYYPMWDAFFLHDGAGANMAASGGAIVSGVFDIYKGGYASSTYLYKQSGATDDGAAITSYLETKREGDGLILRNARAVNISTNLGTQATITYGSMINGETTVGSGFSLDNTVSTGPQDTRIMVNRNCYRIKHRISDQASTATKITGFSTVGEINRVI